MKKLGLILTAVILLGACGKKEENSLNTMETDRFVVSAEAASKRDIAQELLLNGSIKAWEEAVIYPRVEGKLLQNVLKEGDSVKRNQTVALIERDEVGAVYEPVVVPSTINGVVGKTYLDPGANVTKSTPITLVVNQHTVRINIDIPERYIGKIHIGQAASFTVEAYGDKTFKAEIYKISPVVDPVSRAVTVELKANNAEGLIKSGMFAKVSLVLEKRSGTLSVLSSNIQESDSKNYVFVASESGDTAVRTEVKTGLRGNAYSEIISGIPENAKVINIVFGLKDGSKIKVEEK